MSSAVGLGLRPQPHTGLLPWDRAGLVGPELEMRRLWTHHPPSVGDIAPHREVQVSSVQAAQNLEGAVTT